MDQQPDQQPLVMGSFGLDQGRHARWQGDPGSSLQQLDILVEEQFIEAQPWGMEASIDLSRCNPLTIRDSEQIRAFTVALCDVIRMSRYGDPLLVHFGTDERVSGYSLVQLIETSAITAHFIEQVDAICLNIFSCACYQPYAAAVFCQRWFGAQDVRVSVSFRGPMAGGNA